MIITPVMVTLWLWSKDLIKEKYHDYRYEQKMDQVYEQFLEYGPEFWGDQWGISESYYDSEEERKKDFIEQNKDLYRDIDQKKIYKVGIWQDKQLITGTDYDTFTSLFSEYSRDKNFIYRHGEKTIYDVNKHPKQVGQFIVDDDYVYTEEQIILTGADPATFENISINKNGEVQWTQYYKDKSHIYDYDSVVAGVDYETFQPLNIVYSKDNNNIFYFSKIISWADVSSFQILDYFSNYAKDNDTVYWGMQILTWADVWSFDLIHNYNGSSYAKDNNTYRKWSNKIAMPLEVTFDDEFVYIPADDVKIPRHGRDPWDVYQMYSKGDV